MSVLKVPKEEVAMVSLIDWKVSRTCDQLGKMVTWQTEYIVPSMHLKKRSIWGAWQGVNEEVGC